MRTITFRRVVARARTFGGNADGQIAMLFGLMAVMLVTAAGGGVDLMRAYHARQKLSEIAALTCQYASRPSVLQLLNAPATAAPGAKSYGDTVEGYIGEAVKAQQLNWTVSNPKPFTQTGTGPADVELTISVPTAFARVIKVDEIPVSAKTHCYDSPSSPGREPEVYVVKEGFETRGGTNAKNQGNWEYYTINGRTIATPSSDPGAKPVYTGANNSVWYGTGYCLETDQVGAISGTVPEGRQSAELDCDNGSGSAGNSAISTKAELKRGNYELRYFYRSRVTYANYDPAYLCGSAAGDLSWANDTRSSGGPVANASRTNQINVYLDRTTTETSTNPPLHTTLDGSQQLAGANLIDHCVYSNAWVERSVRITIATPGHYWLTFAADGQNESYGGQLDNVRLCTGTCPDTLQDNFPTAWTGGAKVLFADTFEAPVYSEDSPKHGISKGGNLALSMGTSGTSESGWPDQVSSGWITAPFNQVNYGTPFKGTAGAHQGSQYLLLDGWNADGGTVKNRSAMRPFLLDPGYYRVSYGYISIVDFTDAGVTGTKCFTNPGSGVVHQAASETLTGTIRYYSKLSTDRWTNIVGVFMANGQLISTPVAGAAQGKATSFRNPDGTTTTTPTVPPDAVNWQSYNAGAVNPVVDTCGYADGYKWVPRTATVKITKPGVYWLIVSANGSAADGNGGGVDDVKVTALGGAYMTTPANATTIPVPDPQPGSLTYFDGFTIVADPFAPTAPIQ